MVRHILSGCGLAQIRNVEIVSTPEDARPASAVRVTSPLEIPPFQPRTVMEMGNVAAPVEVQPSPKPWGWLPPPASVTPVTGVASVR